MDWLLENWFQILIFVLFIGMHIFGHGGHGGHRDGDGQPGMDERKKDEAQDRVEKTSSGGHQH